MYKVFFILITSLVTCAVFSQNISRSEARQALYIETYHNDEYVGSATGFIIRSAAQNYLVTCYHVVTNRDPKTKKWSNSTTPLEPNRIAIFHNTASGNKHFVKFEDLYDRTGKGRKKLWLENYVRLKKKRVLTDVVQLPLKDTSDIKVEAVDYHNKAVYDYKRSIMVASFPLAVKDLHSTATPAEGLIGDEIAQDSASTALVWVNENILVEMSGSPVFFAGNVLGGKATVSDSTTFSSGIFVGMYTKMPEKASGLIEADFLANNFEALIKPSSPKHKHIQQFKRQKSK